jgi:hypothetical protein
VLDLLEAGDRRGTDALGGRVAGPELRILGLERSELVEKRIVLVVSDLGIVEYVVAMVVMLELAPQLCGPGGRPF